MSVYDIYADCILYRDELHPPVHLIDFSQGIFHETYFCIGNTSVKFTCLSSFLHKMQTSLLRTGRKPLSGGRQRVVMTLDEGATKLKVKKEVRSRQTAPCHLLKTKLDGDLRKPQKVSRVPTHLIQLNLLLLTTLFPFKPPKKGLPHARCDFGFDFSPDSRPRPENDRPKNSF